jgi:hypothetical protein
VCLPDFAFCGGNFLVANGVVMSVPMNRLETNVMEMLLSGDDSTLEVLRQQYRAANVAKRELTGVGFFITFTIPSQIARIEGNPSFDFGDVAAQIVGLQRGSGFVLHVRDGALNFLEGYSYDEPWPNDVDHFQLSFVIVQGATWTRQRPG